MKRLKLPVFLPPFLIILFSAIYSLVDAKAFVDNAKALNQVLLANFGWLYSLGAVFILGICMWAYFSPLAKVKIGGANAKPILTRWQWFSITLCATVAIGILLWGTAEPLYHLHSPPKGLGIEPNTPEAARFALSTLFMHWAFVPYGIYTIGGLLFALMYYNFKQPFSLGSLLYPLLGDKAHGTFGKVIDAICLYTLVAGMAASLGTGMLMIQGGLDTVFGIPKSAFVLGIIAISIVGVFIISAASGLMKGIRVLSDWNVKALFVFCLFVFFFGPTKFILGLGIESIGDYFQHFFQRSLYTGAAAQDDWAKDWTIFYLANWLAWAPVAALFLGRLAVGYTVRDFINVNLIFPSLFTIFWMMVFGGTAIHLDFIEGQQLYGILNTEGKGAESVLYTVFEELPLAQITSIIILLISFLSFVTAADSNTTAMSGISSTGISPESPEPPLTIKIILGLTIGLIAWVMVTQADLDGIRLASTLGGFPALFLVLGVTFALIRVIRTYDGSS